jgi:hypothetical protein
VRRSLWDHEARRNLLARLDRLKPDAAPMWGRMNAPQMIAHLIDWMRLIKGELPAAPLPTMLRRSPFKQAVIYVMPWPKGVPTARELITRAPDEWGTEIAVLREHLVSCESLGASAAWPDHPAFGTLSTRAWGVLGYRHTDHHFRQFRV